MAAFAVGALMFPSMFVSSLMVLVLGLVGVLILHGEGWRRGALLVASFGGGTAILFCTATLVLPPPMGRGLQRSAVPERWLVPDPVLGYSLSRGTTVLMTATFDGAPLYRVFYTIGEDGNRSTPPAPAGSDTYLFMGDSFVFGDALNDRETLPWQFADRSAGRVRAVNLGVPGYAPNQLVRALEAGLLDSYSSQPVKAVVTWIIPAQLDRVTGDAPWLGGAPRYIVHEGHLQQTGSFSTHRWHNPLAGVAYWAREQFPFVALIGQRQRQQEQAALFVALIDRLQRLLREKFGAPLIVLYSWPDRNSPPNYSGSLIPQPLLAETIDRLLGLDIHLVSVNRLTSGLPLKEIQIPHDGHPTAHVTKLVATELYHLLGIR